MDIYYAYVLIALLAAALSAAFLVCSLMELGKMVRRYSDLNRFKHLKILAEENNLYIVEMKHSSVFVLYRKNPDPSRQGIRLGNANSIDELETLLERFTKKVKYSDKIEAERYD